MNCLPCLRKKASKDKKSDEKKSDVKEDEELPVAQPKQNPIDKQPSVKNVHSNKKDEDSDAAALDETPAGSARRFKYQELASATKNFKAEHLLGESGFGKVYKGTLADGKVVAVKQLKKPGTKANKEFIEEVIRLSDLQHPNLVKLIGYCADDDNRLLVYEYMPMGSIKDHLHDLPPGERSLDWIIRMKVAAGAAQVLEYLHEKVDPPVLCGNVRSTNVLLDKNFGPKVTDYGLVNLESSSSGSNLHKTVVGTVGCAPESEYTGELTLKSHVYSFGVVLLELITGRKALDSSRPFGEQNLVYWAQPYFNDPKKIYKLVDPMFKGVVPEKSLNQAVEVAAMCLQDEWSVRPSISDIKGTLSFLTVPPPEGFIPQPEPTKEATSALSKQYLSSSSSSSSSDSDSDQELGIEIEPFNRPEPEPRLEPEPETDPEPEPESEHEPEWESEAETEPGLEPEIELKTDLEPELDFTDSDSDSDSDSDPEPISKLEPVLEPVSMPKSKPDVTNSNSDSDSDLDPEPISKPDPAPESVSMPEPVLDPMPTPEPEFSDDDKASTSILINSKSKARMKAKSTKKKVMFDTEGTDSIKPSMKRVNSSFSKKSFKKSKDDDINDDDDDQSSSNSYNQTVRSKSRRKSDSRGDDHSDVEFTDESDDEFGPQRFKSTISRFSAESRSYSEYQDESDHGSTSEGEK
ncbi:hypothetical protein E3N88_00545 [Mikania micrantha]|uniref:Protein kinase domain-containing protein n=1 Tax=Mikania micrantha TaxID=192012 RepID=A0A5N6PYF0_9ASTR|nr:hypothetical protein E3N88_00545 [Mikania micrantha]